MFQFSSFVSDHELPVLQVTNVCGLSIDRVLWPASRYCVTLLLSVKINARQVGIMVEKRTVPVVWARDSAEFIGRIIGVARRSGLTVVASSYENKTLLKKPLLR